MKFKQVYKIVFTLCGIVFLIAGVCCLVVGMLLQYDGQLQKSIESQSRVYSTQYWLGLPLIFYGVVVMITRKVHEQMKLIFFNLLATIPMFILTFTGSILHGTSLAHFMSMERQQSYLIDRGYLCENSNADNLCVCKRPRDFQMQEQTFSILCSELSKLVTLHGMLFSFGVIATGFLFSILFTSVVFLFQIQLPARANSTENQGFSNHGQDEEPNLTRRTASLPSLANSGISPSQSPITNEPPPSYESLISSFVVTDGVPSVGRNPPSAPRRPPEVIQHATVRYRGELNSNPDSFPQARNPHGQAILHETTNVTESTSQGELPSVITEDVSTRNSSERGAQLRSNAQLEDNNGAESEDNSANHNVPPHSNNPNLSAAVRESGPRQDNVPEENTDIASTSENTDNIELNSAEVDRREGEHENIPQEEDFVVTIVATGYSMEGNTAEVEQSRFTALQVGSSDVTTASRVSYIPENLSRSTRQTDNIRASDLTETSSISSHPTRDGIFNGSIVDI